MNEQNEPESIEAKIALLESAVREQMSALADARDFALWILLHQD
jgi:hypothetical protein